MPELDAYNELHDALRFTPLKRLRVVKIVCPHYNQLLDVLRVNGRLIVIHTEPETVYTPLRWTPSLAAAVESDGYDLSTFKLSDGVMPSVRPGHRQCTYLEELDKAADPAFPCVVVATPGCCYTRARTVDLPWLHQALAEHSGEVEGKKIKVYPDR